MEKEKKLLLPQLKVNENITESQCWKQVDNPYGYLIQNLKLSYESVDSIFDGKSSAMPHVFEQMLLFERAFWDEHDPDHTRAILEWRAVLAIMALPRICNHRLTLHKVDFSTPESPFLSAAAEFRPKESPVFDQTTWDFLYVLKLNDTAIALFSPTTLVCPAKQFKQRIGELNWLRIEKINGIEQLSLEFHGNGLQKIGLADWLDELCASLSPAVQAPEITEKVDRVKQELILFSQEVALDRKNATPLYSNYYPAINRSHRKEYSFLNNCCNFNLIDPDMEFLVDFYQQDIFLANLMVVVYDRAVDSMNRQSNIPLLDRLFTNIFQLNGQAVTSIRMEGGERLAAHALLPFNQTFTEELVHHQLTPERVIEGYSCIYRRDVDAVEITLQIRGFPYAFCKCFPRVNWKLIYGVELPSVRLWPSENLEKNSWNQYYIHVSHPYTQEIQWDAPLRENFYTLSKYTESREKFQISQCQFFPSLLRCTYKSDVGYLPICASDHGKGYAGETVLILFDIGHSTTAIKLIQFSNVNTSQPVELSFWIPHAVCFAGNAGNQDENFISARQMSDSLKVSSFKNIIKTFCAYDAHGSGCIRPFEHGVVLFDLPDDLTSLHKQAICFLNFEYNHMDVLERQNAHTFIEQLMFYAAHTAALHQSSYLQVGFLHSYPDDDHRVGELEQVFCNAMEQVKTWSGLKKSMMSPIHCMCEGEALVYRLYLEIIKNQKNQDTNENEKQKESQRIYAALDIGWKKTTLAAILKTKGKPEAQYTQISFAGKDFSLLNGTERLVCYPEMLNILLSGRKTIDSCTPEGILLEEFRQYCIGAETERLTFYQGIFDTIAQKIDETGFVMPPDIYNRTDEFRAVLQMLTYNVFLLFLNVGYMLGCFFKDNNVNEKHIELYLSGNGTKFLNWICNTKKTEYINADNVKKMFILDLQYTIIDVIRFGFAISNENSENKVIPSIYLFNDGKEQLLNGFSLKRQPRLFNLEHTPPNFEVTLVSNSFLQNDHKENFYGKLSDLRSSVFGSSVQGISGNDDSTNQLDEIIRTESQCVCDAIIETINKM